MNQKIMDLLPKKYDAAKISQECGDNRGYWYNRAINDVITALSKAEIAIVPSVEELANILDECPYICFDNGCTGVDDAAKAIRQLMLGKEDGGKG